MSNGYICEQRWRPKVYGKDYVVLHLCKEQPKAKQSDLQEYKLHTQQQNASRKKIKGKIRENPGRQL